MIRNTFPPRANSSVVVSGAIELLVHACSNQDRAIRLAGQENLHKLVKVKRTTFCLATSEHVTCGFLHRNYSQLICRGFSKIFSMN